MKLSRLKQAALLTLASLVSQPETYAEQPHSVQSGSGQLDTKIEGSVPAFTLTDIDKQEHNLADYRGKVLLINFWASWCTPCLLEMPGLSHLNDEFSDSGFAVLTLNISDDPRRIKETLRRLQVDLTVLLDHDGETFAAWHGRILPASYLLDRDGRVIKRFVGEIDWHHEKITALINRLLQEH